MRTLKNSILIFFSFLLLAFSQPILAQPQLLLDMRSGEVLYEKDAGVAWYPASLTKLMTSYLVFEAIKEGKVTLKTPVIMSKIAKKAPYGIALPSESAITLEDALYLLIVKSANDVAVALAETISGSQEAFVKQMNQSAKKLGMNGTNFTNPNGLHNKNQFSTARDLAILALTIKSQYRQYNRLFSTSEVKLGTKILQSRNNLLTGFIGTDGMKTGFICSAGLNIVATVKRNNKYLMVIILGASSKRGRAEMAAQLLLKGFSGELNGTGKTITRIGNRLDSSAKDMRPLICGGQARDYVATREKQFPYGLNGQPSFLNKNIVIGSRVNVASLGRIRNVPLPRTRPNYIAPIKPIEENITKLIVPIPKPRISR